MATATVNGITLGYETIGEGRPWVITPGGRFTKESPGVRELAVELAAHGNRVLIWDRPNCGASDVCFDGDGESSLQGRVLAELLQTLDLGPAALAGGSAGPYPSRGRPTDGQRGQVPEHPGGQLHAGGLSC